MIKRLKASLSLVCLGVPLFALFGCTEEPSDSVVAKCADECEAASDCPGGGGDCVEACEEERDFAERVGCTPQYELLIDCFGTLTDPCSYDACDLEVTSYSTCLGEFCGANPMDPACPQ
ncbi:MAG: hypothetical protein U0271_29250 [Polyangiaceae bacterium]